MEQVRITKSISVESLFGNLPPNEAIDASEIARRLFRDHAGYAGATIASVQLADTGSKRQPEQWLEAIEDLYDDVRMEQWLERQPYSSKSNQSSRASIDTPRLNGRLVIVGLALLEPSLYQQLTSLGIFDALVGELNYPLEDILTPQGQQLYEKLIGRDDKLRQLPEESVPSLSDNALGKDKDEEDLLGRKPFAKFLARRIQEIAHLEKGAYSIHIKGQWGSGKTSLLNFLQIELKALEPKDGKKWVVADFNAWRNQQIQPPWWALLEKVFQDVKGKLSIGDLLAEYWWRFNTGRLQYIFGFVTLLWLFVYFVRPFWSQISSQADILGLTAKAAESLSKIVALIVTVWGGLIAINRSLLFGSARAAQNYMELAHDPTGEIKKRFEGLIRRLKTKRVAIIIDDLDRCQSEYVVELLEGIQTLYREAGVIFIVAADERWLHACYEQVYEKLSERVSEPGKSLGALFLEKAFRFSTPMPGIPMELRERFWRHLLALKSKDTEINESNVQARAKEKLEGARSEQEVGVLVNASRNLPFAEERAIREAAVIRLAVNEVQERLEHTLAPYFDLLEPNPRSMKRFVNSFSANRALAILSEVDIELHQLALWTILSSRWPAWADYLTRNPEMLENVKNRDQSQSNKVITQMVEVSELQRVINDERVINGEKILLEIDTLRKSAKMQA